MIMMANIIQLPQLPGVGPLLLDGAHLLLHVLDLAVKTPPRRHWWGGDHPHHHHHHHHHIIIIMFIIISFIIIQMEPRNFLPWILSAMVHSVIIYGLYGMHGALDLDAPGGETLRHMWWWWWWWWWWWDTLMMMMRRKKNEISVMVYYSSSCWFSFSLYSFLSSLWLVPSPGAEHLVPLLASIAFVFLIFITAIIVNVNGHHRNYYQNYYHICHQELNIWCHCWPQSLLFSFHKSLSGLLGLR